MSAQPSGIAPDQRYTNGRTCPICGGSEDRQRNVGERCRGYIGGDGLYAHCSRGEMAGGLPAHPKAGTYAHKLKGQCRCGVVHSPDDAPAKPKRPAKAGKGKGECVAEYDYLDAAGKLAFQVQRFVQPDGTKTFGQRRPNPAPPHWLYSLRGVTRVLYQLPELLAADPARPVYLVEGEKDADRLRTLRLTATCCAGGADGWRKDYAASLAGRSVRIIIDNDDPGRKFGESAAQDLRGVAAEVRMLDLAQAARDLGKDLPVKGDTSDYLDMGGTVGAIDRAFLVAPEWQPVRLHNPDERPEIAITTDEATVNDAAILALSADPNIYSRGPILVSVRRDKRKGKLVNRPVGSPWIAQMPKALIREKMARHARWFKPRRDPKPGEPTRTEAHPPDWSVATVEARGAESPDIRHLEDIIEAPALLGDGSILDVPGYDEGSGLLYEPSTEFPPIPSRVTQAQARAAAAEILDVVADFPFAVIGDDGGACHQAAWLASLLTPLARHAIDGPCPLFFIDANTSGAGKSKLCDIVAILTTGRGAARTAFPDSDEEMRKQIISIALEGDRLILIDNVTTGAALGGASLDMVLTGTTVKGRVLGKSEMTRELPIYTVWYATGNNLGLRGDMLRRVVPLRLESPWERPEERPASDFRIRGDLLKYVADNRARLAVAALTILRGFFLAGRPQADLVPMDYPAWSAVVRQAVYWAVGVDPCETRRELIADDPETNQLKAVVTGWAELPNGTIGLTAARALDHLRNPDLSERFGMLRNALVEWSRDGDFPSPRIIGMKLKQVKGRIIEGRTIRSRSFHGTLSWYVVEVQRGGTSGTSGTSTPHAHKKPGNDDGRPATGVLASTAGQGPTSPTSPTFDPDRGDAWEGDPAKPSEAQRTPSNPSSIFTMTATS